MRILLLGADGQLGTELRRRLAPLGDLVLATRDGQIDGLRCEQADVTRFDALRAMLDRVAPTVIVNATAYTAVDRAEQERDLAWRVNAEAPAVLGDVAARAGARLVHYSTDYVFDGRADRPYREDDAPAPLGVYGASKLAGETAIRASDARHLIFRTAWLYAAHGHNFLRTMLRLGAEREHVRVVADQVGAPTPASLLADVTAVALQREAASGTWHVTATGQTSWYGFAQAIFDGAQARGLLPRAPRVEAITARDYAAPAARPAYSVLDTARAAATFGISLPSWQDGLGGVLDRLASDAG